MTDVIVPTAALLHLLWFGGCWIALCAAWVAACILVDRDARYVFGAGMPWSLLMAVSGVGLLASAAFLGFAGQPVLLAAMAVIVGVYLRRREARVLPPHRVLTAKHARRLLESVIARLPAARATTPRSPEPQTTGTASHLISGMILLRRDGTQARGRPGEVSDRRAAHTDLVARDIVAEALSAGATEIRLGTAAKGKALVRFRLDGVPADHACPDGTRGADLVAAFRGLADLVPAGHATQEGGFIAAVAGGTLDIRVTAADAGLTLTLPDTGGEGGGPRFRRGLEPLGLPPQACESLRWILQQPRGLLLICGPEDSGKTTTAAAVTAEIDPLVHRVATVEDAVTHRLPHVAQHAVNASAGLTAAALLRDVTTRDWDAILLDAIHDRETAATALLAAGRCTVIATLRAKDAADALVRLLAFGLDPATLHATVAGVLAQRLARILCEHCKVPYAAPPEFLKKLDRHDAAEVVIHKKKGCPDCRHTGYRGRTLVPELLLVDDAMRATLADRPSARSIRAQARRSGMQTQREAAVALVARGVTSVKEIVRVVP